MRTDNNHIDVCVMCGCVGMWFIACITIFPTLVGKKTVFTVCFNVFVQQEHQEPTTILRGVFAAFGCICMHFTSVYKHVSNFFVDKIQCWLCEFHFLSETCVLICVSYIKKIF